MKGIDNYSDKGELFALPFSINYGVTYYNKDIFDKFGVAYPKDGMTWDNAIELGKKLARTDGGVTYQPLNAGYLHFFIGPLETPISNYKTNVAIFQTDPMKKALALYKSVTDLPGNQASVNNGRNAFEKEQKMAMLPDWGAVVGELDTLQKQGKSFNWDMTTYPTIKEYPGVDPVHGPFLMGMSSTSKHKDDAFRALDVIMSDENQTLVTRSGRLSALVDKKIQTNFGVDLDSLKGKNVQAVFKNRSAIAQHESNYSTLATKELDDAAAKVVKEQADINTALREAEEAATKAMIEAAGK
jgi:multiple sugar transport system substrate-binding protein